MCGNRIEPRTAGHQDQVCVFDLGRIFSEVVLRQVTNGDGALIVNVGRLLVKFRRWAIYRTLIIEVCAVYDRSTIEHQIKSFGLLKDGLEYLSD